MHLGNLRTALLAWALARHAGGTFILRLEDLDRPRVCPGAEARALADLAWLGLDWDEGPDLGGPVAPYRQSERASHYDAAVARLDSLGLVYPCYCSRADIARAVNAPHGPADDGPCYPGTCREPEGRERQRRACGARPPALRLRVPPGAVTFVDGLHGGVAQDVSRTVGDLVLRRADGVPSYHLAVVVDDAAMGVTDVVRGADLLDSTPRQIVLYRLLGLPAPRFLHVPLTVDHTGARLAKRHGATGIDPLRAAGVPPEHMVGALVAGVGLVPPGTTLTARALVEHLDLTRIIRGPSCIPPIT